MAKIEPKIFDELKTALSSFHGKYFVGEELNRSKLTDDLRNYDEALLSKLFEVDFVNQHFIKEVAGQKLFQIEHLEEAVLYNDYWDTSYTKYENRVGLASKGKFLQDSQDVVLDFPFKDGVLTASMTKEDNEDGYDDAFLNEVIEKDEIDRLFDKKIFVNSKRYDGNGESAVADFNEDKDNLIIKGNNLLALHALKEKYAGKVKLIYIDPPYNTGSDSFAYNDKFNHSAWLTFMKNRLEIAKELLADDGSIWINIDDDESHYLKVLSDSVFNRNNFIGNIIWQKKYSPQNDAKYFSDMHDHILVYAKNKDVWVPNPMERTEAMNSRYTNRDSDPRGVWKSSDFSVRTYSSNYDYEITTPSGRKITPPNNRSWATSKENFEKLVADNRVWFGKDGNNVPSIKKFLSEVKNGMSPITTWVDELYDQDDILSHYWKYEDVSHTQDAKREIIKLGVNFNTPKPEKLLQRIIRIGSNENDLVLDFFMGSATTQAVAMKMNRGFIGIEQMNYINTVSVPRLQKVIEGEQGGISKAVNWQGGGSFVYAELFPKNMGYLQDVIHAKDLAELKSVYERMLSGTATDEPADLSFRADLDKIDWLQGFDENKRLLVKLLDKNGLYYNYSEIDDRNVRDLISDEDYTFNRNFYEGGD